MSKCYLISLLVLLTLHLSAQQDSFYVLPTAHILSIRNSMSQDLNTKEASTALSPALGPSSHRAIASQLGLYLKAYGEGQLSTLSYRGGNSGQLLVLWNGLPLNDPMLGSYDLSLSPFALTNEISLSRGAQTHIWGSGAVTGALQFNNSFSSEEKTTATLSTELGSFGQFRQLAKLSFTSGKYSGQLGLMYSEANNDFDYTIESPLREKNEHARTKIRQLISSHRWRLNALQSLEAHIWLQDAHRETPPTLTQAASQAITVDDAHRGILKWKYRTNSLSLDLMTAISLSNNQFEDSQFNVYNENKATQWTNQLDVTYVFSPSHQLSSGLSFSQQSGRSNNYSDKQLLQGYNLFVAYRFLNGRHLAQLTVQKQWNDRINSTSPQINGLYRFRLAPHLSLEAAILLGAYNLPSLNDLYWSPGGNSELEPEQAWEENVTLQFNNNKWKVRTNVYHRLTKQWILWSPNDRGIWHAQNIGKVRSYGLEFDASKAFQMANDLVSTLDFSYQWTNSISEVNIVLPDIRKGEQLVYVPKHQATLACSVILTRITMGIEHTLRSKVQGLNQELGSYFLTNISAAYKSQTIGDRLSFELYLRLNNLFAETYYLYESRALAGRNIEAGISLTF